MKPAIELTDLQTKILRAGLSETLYAHSQIEGVELESMAARGWLNKSPLKIRRGNLKVDFVYSLTAAGKRAAEKLVGGA